MLNFVYLVGGIALIIYGANWLVEGASSVAKKFGISDLVIGLTIVALGTSAPELTVNIFSALKGSTDIAVGNVLGSNICNILLILGITTMINPIQIKKNTQWREIPFVLLSAIVLGLVANDILLDDATNGNFVTRIDGLVLLCFMAIFLVYTFEISRHSTNSELVGEVEKVEYLPAWKSVAFIVAGLAGLFFGGQYLVEGAVNMAKLLGMSEKVIALTIISIGTSLPELATSVVAARAKKADMAIGNVIGSNIVNTFFILGTTAIIKPLPISASLNTDLAVNLGASILLFIATFIISRNILGRQEGIVFVSLYIVYLIYSLLFNTN
jgi:cation:H+ antiporter